MSDWVEPRWIRPYRPSRIEVRKGQIKMVRLGQLNAWDQRKGREVREAPERRGIWAFPWPYFDMFFASHKFEEVLPKRLKDLGERRADLWKDAPRAPQMPNRFWRLRGTGAIALWRSSSEYKAFEKVEEAWKAENAEAIEELDRLEIEREAWIASHGYKPRAFWWEGDVWTRLTIPGHMAWKDSKGYHDWTLLPISIFVEQLLIAEHNRRDPDFFEVFLAPSRGKIVGRKEHKPKHRYDPDTED